MPGTYCDLFRRRLISSARFVICAYSAATLSMISLDRLSFIDAAYSRAFSARSRQYSALSTRILAIHNQNPTQMRRNSRRSQIPHNKEAVQCSGKPPYRDAKRPRASWHVNIPEKFAPRTNAMRRMRK
jgi:hypothetical protein